MREDYFSLKYPIIGCKQLNIPYKYGLVIKTLKHGYITKYNILDLDSLCILNLNRIFNLTVLKKMHLPKI